MKDWTAAIVSIATAIVGVAILAVLVSQRSQTAGVIKAAGDAFSQALGAATGPVTGGGLTGFGNFGGLGGSISMVP